MNIRHEEVSYPSSNGVNTIVGSIWQPDGTLRGIVQITHGMTEHVERYDWFARQLCAAGFLVCGDDHLGHGRSAPTRDDLGYFSKKNGDQYLIQDEHLLRQLMQKRYPELPYFLLGHSMGSFITRGYITQYGDGLSGYICCGTSGKNPLNRLAILAADLMVALRGGHRRGNLLNKLAFQDYNSRYTGEVITGNNWLSRDFANYPDHSQDPKGNFTFTNAGFRDLFRLLYNVTGTKWSSRIPKDLPILFASGDMDPVGQYGEGVKEVYELVKAAGVRDVTLKLYPQARHELHNELNKDEFVADVVAWIEKHLPS